jgi:hypothetical protein
VRGRVLRAAARVRQGRDRGRIIRSARWEPPRLRTEIEYRVDGDVWTHAWTSYSIGDEELADDLAGAGLRLGDWLTDDRAWFTARPG